MSEAEIAQKTAELDRLLNDPGVRMDPHRVWTLAQELKSQNGSGRPQPRM
jgi:hypothetical protein